MQGGLRERRPGVWEVRAESGRDPLTGRRRQISKTVHGNKRDARRVLNALVAEADRGTAHGTDAPLSDLLDRWLSMMDERLSPTTLRRYRGLITKHIAPALGSISVDRLRTPLLDDFYLALLRDADLAPATVRQVHAILHRALKQAVRWGWVATNPASNATPPPVRRAPISPPDPAAVVRLLSLATAESPAYGLFLQLASVTGARRGELCALQWGDIDEAAETLEISRAVIEVPGGLELKSTKTHGIRRVALDPATVESSREHRSRADATATVAGLSLSPSSFVFTFEPDGRRPWSPDYATKQFIRLRTLAGIPNARLHDLRHFSATQLLALGVPLRTVSGRLGHANATTTLGVYAHFVPESDHEAAALIGSLVADRT
jgi:integrase